ncbi:hypothetical protein [uncultured Pseudoalteromonas sp.]|uniref:GFA family protein n=1 Tax=uncultured Pseudoalteromonas sp. TaxID=114053 RepID=UPI0030DC5F5E
MIEASCHCGNIKIAVPEITDTVTSCNCSACSKYASLWANFSPKDVKFTTIDNSIAREFNPEVHHSLN